MSLHFLNGPAAFVLATFTTEATSCSVICLQVFSAGLGSMRQAYSVLVSVSISLQCASKSSIGIMLAQCTVLAVTAM